MGEAIVLDTTASGFTSNLSEMVMRTTTAIFVQEVCSAIVEPYVHRVMRWCNIPYGRLYRVTFAGLRFLMVVVAFVSVNWVRSRAKSVTK